MIHVPFGVQLPAAVVAMAVKDATSTLGNIASNRGRENLSGWLDVAKDWAEWGVNLSGVGSIIISGITVRTGIVLGAMSVTSYIGTRAWTRIGKRIDASP